MLAITVYMYGKERGIYATLVKAKNRPIICKGSF